MLSIRRRPRLSVIVVAYRMPAQLENTVRSLSPEQQRGADGDDYEIVVVENRSDATASPQRLRSWAPNVRYVLREESGSSPAAAVNAGARLARGRYLAIMVDGARMVTPGVISATLDALGTARRPVVSVPGYHLGDRLHPEAALLGYSTEQEQQMLAEMAWWEDGYRLFDRAVLSASCRDGFLRPIAESNCIALTRRHFRRLGGFDERFTTTGGGFVNLDFYRRCVDSRGVQLLVLPGEGTFHQFHSGATTGAPDVDRDALLDEMRAEYEQLRGRIHAPPSRTPVLFGEVGTHARPFFEHSRTMAQAGADR